MAAAAAAAALMFCWRVGLGFGWGASVSGKVRGRLHRRLLSKCQKLATTCCTPAQLSAHRAKTFRAPEPPATPPTPNVNAAASVDAAGEGAINGGVFGIAVAATGDPNPASSSMLVDNASSSGCSVAVGETSGEGGARERGRKPFLLILPTADRDKFFELFWADLVCFLSTATAGGLCAYVVGMLMDPQEEERAARERKRERFEGSHPGVIR